MNRDTEEWLRPWRDHDTSGTDAPTATDVIVEVEGEVAAPRVAAHGTPIARTVPVTIAIPGADDEDRRITVRPDAPGSRERVQPDATTGATDASSGGSFGLGDAPAVDAPAVSVVVPVVVDIGPDGPARPQAVASDHRTVATIAIAAGLIGALVGTGGTLVAADRMDLFRDGVAAGASAAGEDDPVRAPIVERREVVAGETVVAAVASAVLPSVVRIDVLADETDPDLGAVQVPIGVGSGVIYRSDGYILTNNHVVDGADAVIVQLSDGRSEPAEIVGTDPLTDLAVLRVDLDGLVAVNLRDDVPLQVGETAVAIGSPFGLDASVTAGVVSALNRDLEVPGEPGEGSFVIPALIQTDAAINPGNSGGALVDGNGRLIGINTAILTGSGGSQGVGFAIPTSRAVISADQLIDKGFVAHPFLGISGLDVTNEVAARYREEFGIDLDGGALIDQVVDGSGAALGGVQPGDVIVAISGQSIGSMTDVIGAILRFETGDTLDVVVLRDGERLALNVTLGERPR